MTLTGKARLAGVLGWPVAHSRSPRLHGHWLAQYRIDGAYLPLSVAPEAFDEALRGLIALGFRGANVTIPHKEAAFRACDRLSPFAERVGAVNTLVVEDGVLVGSNSDGYGFLENLRDGHRDWDAGSGPAVVIGAGGAARAVVAALLEAGAPSLTLVNRTRARAETLASDLGGSITVADWQDRATALEGAALLVNCTSQGMSGQAPLDLDLAALPAAALVNDLVYTPLETPLLAAARARGNPVVDGLGMLLHQARPGFEAWFGVAPEVTAELRAAVLAD
ncbi:MAG: shikimate dehydrogenase [Pseudomonadota bacterium]